MPKLLSPMLGAAVAAVVMGSTGYCAFNPVQDDPPATTLGSAPPVRLLPEAVVPFDLEPLGTGDEPV